MNEELKQDLSAMLDDELEMNRALKLMGRVSSDQELSKLMHRYQIAQELMHSPDALVPDAGFADRIAGLIAEEPAILAPRVSLSRRYRDKVVNLALAASVAAVAILVGRSITAHSPMESGEILAQVQMESPTVKASMEPDLRDYLTMHNESSQKAGTAGVLPSVRLVSGAAAGR